MNPETFQRICSWCKGTLPGHDANAKETSHGICAKCAEQAKAERELARSLFLSESGETAHRQEEAA